MTKVRIHTNGLFSGFRHAADPLLVGSGLKRYRTATCEQLFSSPSDSEKQLKMFALRTTTWGFLFQLHLTSLMAVEWICKAILGKLVSRGLYQKWNIMSSQSYVAAHGVPCVSWIQEKGDGCCNCSRKVSEGREWTFVSVRGATNHKFEYSSMLTDTTCKCRP